MFGGVGGWGGGTIIFFDEETLRGVVRIRVESTTLKIKEKIATGVFVAKCDFGTKWTVKPLVVL